MLCSSGAYFLPFFACHIGAGGPIVVEREKLELHCSKPLFLDNVIYALFVAYQYGSNHGVFKLEFRCSKSCTLAIKTRQSSPTRPPFRQAPEL